MKDKVMPYIRTVLFLVLFAVIVGCMNFLFAQTGYVRYVLHHINEKSNNYDTLILGASHARSAIDPKYMDEEMGTDAFNFAIPGSSVKDSYYQLLDAADKNDIKNVIFDVDFYYWLGYQDTTSFYKGFVCNEIKDPDVRIRYLLDNMRDIDIRNACVNRASWEITAAQAKKSLNKKFTKAYRDYDIEGCEKGEDGYVLEANGPYLGKGYFSRVTSGDLPGGEEFVSCIEQLAYCDFDEYVTEWFDKIIDFCKERDIDLVCIYTPVTPVVINRLHIDVADEKLKDYFASRDIDYYNFNLLTSQVLARTDRDFGDLEGHMGGDLGDKYSRILAHFLKERKDHTLQKEKYFYASFSEMNQNLKSDYEKVTGMEWGGY